MLKASGLTLQVSTIFLEDQVPREQGEQRPHDAGQVGDLHPPQHRGEHRRPLHLVAAVGSSPFSIYF